jgi:hypothetical protein
MSKPPPIASTDEAIDALGGNTDVGKIVGVSHKAVSNWRRWNRGRFPAETYLALNAALAKIGRTAEPRLWGMIGAETEAA